MEQVLISICGIEITTLVINDYIKSKNKHYKLQKTKEMLKKESDKSKITKPIYLKLTKEEKEKISEIEHQLKQNNKIIYDFYQTLIKKTDKKNLRHFFNNVQSLKIYKKTKKPILMLITGNNTLGKYISPNNEIEIYLNKNKVLTHELLHMASASLTYSVIGFHRIFPKYLLNKYKNLDEKNNEIGIGINEGYTEILNNRLFKNRSVNYILLQKIAILIEQFYENKENMKADYFNGNINGIIYELSKYIKLNEIIDLIIDIDELVDDNLINILKYWKIKKRLLEIYSKNKSEEEINEFKKIYKSNQIIKVLKKQI